MHLDRIALLFVLVLCACGGEEPASATREEFAARADEVCTEYNEKFREHLAELSTQGAPARDEAFNEFVAKYADDYATMTDDLDELAKPRDDVAVERYLDRLERNAQGLREAADDKSGTTDAFGQAYMNSMREANALAEKAGLEACSPPDGF